jgi:hypothetical protein
MGVSRLSLSAGCSRPAVGRYGGLAASEEVKRRELVGHGGLAGLGFPGEEEQQGVGEAEAAHDGEDVDVGGHGGLALDLFSDERLSGASRQRVRSLNNGIAVKPVPR